MTAKPRLDIKSGQQFLLQHVEKIGFAIVLLLCGWMVYSGTTGSDRYPKTPDALISKANDGQRVIETAEKRNMACRSGPTT